MKANLIVLASIFAVATLVSCDKTESLSVTQTENSQLIGEEQAVELVSTEIDAIADEALTVKSLSGFRSAAADSTSYLGTCATLTLDSTNTKKILTIDFGTNCVGKDGKSRSGKIIITSESFSEVIGITRFIEFSKFTINGDTISGSIRKKTVSFLDLYKRKAYLEENIVIKRKNNGGIAKRIAEVFRIYDINRPALIRDDKITIWGNVEFINTKGATIVKNATELKPLVYRKLCHQIVSGLEVVVRSEKTLTIDFGDGSCDGIATVTDGTNSWVIKL